MDPEATLRRLRHAIESCNYSEAVAALNDYYQWRLKDGHQPLHGDSRADSAGNRIADELASMSD